MDVHSGWGESGIRSKLSVLTAHTRFEPTTESLLLAACAFVLLRDKGRGNRTMALNIYSGLSVLQL